MKTLLISLALFLILAFTSNSEVNAAGNKYYENAIEQDSLSGHTHTTSTIEDTVNSANKIWNKICPVMGEEVDPKVQTSKYGDKVIGFCCKSCVRKFNGNPEKYMKKLNEDGTALKEN